MPHKVLLVDDSQLIHRLVQNFLGKDGVLIESMYTAPEVVAKAAEMQPAIILLDMELPPYSGLDVCRELKADARTRDCIVVILSGNSEPEHVARAKAVGADDYIAKPFTANDLRIRIRGWLRHAAKRSTAA